MPTDREEREAREKREAAEKEQREAARDRAQVGTLAPPRASTEPSAPSAAQRATVQPRHDEGIEGYTKLAEGAETVLVGENMTGKVSRLTAEAAAAYHLGDPTVVELELGPEVGAPQLMGEPGQEWATVPRGPDHIWVCRHSTQGWLVGYLPTAEPSRR